MKDTDYGTIVTLINENNLLNGKIMIGELKREIRLIYSPGGGASITVDHLLRLLDDRFNETCLPDDFRSKYTEVMELIRKM